MQQVVLLDEVGGVNNQLSTVADSDHDGVRWVWDTEFVKLDKETRVTLRALRWRLGKRQQAQRSLDSSYAGYCTVDKCFADADISCTAERHDWV